MIIKSAYHKSSNSTFWPQRYDERLDEITSEERGTWSERDLISSLLDYGISPKAIFHDLYIKNGKYGFSQIDVVVATKVGLIVFEVKDYAGWIFGRAKDTKWTKSLYDKYHNETHKYRFYNPVLQNESHIKVLQKQSKQFADLPFYSVIVFYGDSELIDINFIPDGTFVIKPHRLNDVLDIILDNDEAEYTDKREVMRILKSAVDNGANPDTQTEHVDKLKDMLGKDRVLD
ncbi:MAG: NERD domain-containing protein [Alphaproteobacteria bacterium]|nr:NERD domain-containing protein [Alphaproteobacteria bacterium]